METLASLLVEYKYVILFPLAFIEGPITAFVVGTLVVAGYFNPAIAFAVLVLGDVIPDNAYYVFGRFGERRILVNRYAAKIGITPERFDTMRKLWADYPIKTMLITKFAYGLSTPLLVSAGIVDVPYRRFLRHTFVISCVQYGVLMGLGYYFGSSFGLVSRSLEGLQFLAAGAVGIAVFYYFLGRALRDVFIRHKDQAK